ncbi:MAG: 8-amino-7-oxononanoate synthase [Nevskiales bacterium]
MRPQPVSRLSPTPASSLARFLREQLAAVRARQLFRRRRVVAGAHAVQLRVDGQDCLNFCSNDYLGLAAHPEVIRALQQAAATQGVGSGASAYVSGWNAEHQALEQELADFVQRPRALLFSTGYQCNLGVIQALAGRGDHVYSDELNHASLIDGCRLSGAAIHRYRHVDASDLASQLAAPVAGHRPEGHRLIVSDGVFSMDGDPAPLVKLTNLAQRHDAWLMVDDAHGFGVLGPQGRGSLAALGLGTDDVPVLVATLGKALGGFGAFVAGEDDLIEYLLQRARTAIFTTALPPALAAAMRVSLRLLRAEEWRRTRLHALIARFREASRQLALPVADSQTPIQPLFVGDETRALALSAALQSRGFLIGAIRPPTVPVGTSRLRITLSAAHNEAQVDALLEALASAWRTLDAA